MLPVETIAPDYPFQHLAVIYIQLGRYNYGVYVDSYTGWPGVYTGSGAADVVTFLTRLCQDYGCPETVTSDGVSKVTAKSVEDMMKTYGIRHRVSSVANPQAKSREEDAEGQHGQALKLDAEHVSRAFMTVRNTPDRDTRTAGWSDLRKV